MASAINWKTPNVARYMSDETICCGNGEYCVYFWKDISDGAVFYVGCGKGYRFSSVNEKARTQEFVNRIDKGDCRPFIVAYGLSQAEAFALERKTITMFWNRNEPLTNRQGIAEREAEYRRRGVEKFNIGEYMKSRIASVDEKQFEQEYKLWRSGQITAKTAMSHLGLKPNTFYRRVAAYEVKENI